MKGINNVIVLEHQFDNGSALAIKNIKPNRKGLKYALFLPRVEKIYLVFVCVMVLNSSRFFKFISVYSALIEKEQPNVGFC